MKTFIVFATIVLCAFASPVTHNGELEDEIAHSKNGLAALVADHGGLGPMVHGRIVGGVVATIEEFPWAVTMQHQGSHRCGGSIISATRILSAAQCTMGIAPGALSIRAGATFHSDGGQLVGVSAIVNHPQFNAATLNNNIGILNLASALNTELAGIAIIARPPQGAGTAAGVTATVAGWGATFEAGPPSLGIISVSKTVISNAECNSQVGGGIVDQMMCAGVPDGEAEACHGDTGAGLTFGGQLVGIVRWGFRCARPGSPGIYTRTSAFTNWINGNL